MNNIEKVFVYITENIKGSWCLQSSALVPCSSPGSALNSVSALFLGQFFSHYSKNIRAFTHTFYSPELRSSYVQAFCAKGSTLIFIALVCNACPPFEPIIEEEKMGMNSVSHVPCVTSLKTGESQSFLHYIRIIGKEGRSGFGEGDPSSLVSS